MRNKYTTNIYKFCSANCIFRATQILTAEYHNSEQYKDILTI